MKIVVQVFIFLIAVMNLSAEPIHISAEFFRLETIEHVLGVEAAIYFFLSLDEVKSSPDFKVLGAHPNYVDRRAKAHDIEKVNHSQSFKHRFYPNPQDSWLSERIASLWGIDIFGRSTNVKQISAELRSQAKATIYETNEIDKKFVGIIDYEYQKQENLSDEEMKELSEAFHRIEIIADLINRNYLEKELVHRLAKLYPDEHYIYEFGSPFQVANAESRFWPHPTDMKLALKYFENLELGLRMHEFSTGEKVFERFASMTEKDFLENPDELHELKRYFISRDLDYNMMNEILGFEVFKAPRNLSFTCRYLFH